MELIETKKISWLACLIQFELGHYISNGCFQ